MSRILVVDDDDTIRETLHELLSEEYVCQTAETAEKAFARLEADVYDVVLTDISMPGLSGLELLEYIRQRFSDTPVIIVSGIGDREQAQSLIKLGAFDFLLKPFTLEGVEQSVKRAVDYRKRLLERASAEEATREETEQNKANDWKIVREDSR
jgi:two-component system, NtrC family, response regulator PilR